MSERDFTVRRADWATEQPLLKAVRTTVFVDEQHVPAEIEWDAMDPLCVHALAVDGEGCPVGTARLLPDGHIGRVAVLAPWRGSGVGLALMRWMIDAAREAGHFHVALNSQQSAAGFYERLGFRVDGDEFWEAGIPHVPMSLALNAS